MHIQLINIVAKSPSHTYENECSCYTIKLQDISSIKLKYITMLLKES